MKRETFLEIVARAAEITIIFLLAIPLYFVCNYLEDFSPLVMLIIFGVGYVMPWKE